MMDVDELWEDYYKYGSLETKKELMTYYLPLVKGLARQMNIKLNYAVDYDDLVNTGVIGLENAIKKYNPSKDVRFETFAYMPIRGAMLNIVRDNAWFPESIRAKQKTVEAAISDIEFHKGRSPNDSEIAEKLGMDMESYNKLVVQTLSVSVTSLNEYLETGMDVSTDYTRPWNKLGRPERAAIRRDLHEQIGKALERLTKNERKTIIMYYFGDKNTPEIAKQMGLSPTRVIQLKNTALRKLRYLIGEEYKELINGI